MTCEGDRENNMSKSYLHVVAGIAHRGVSGVQPDSWVTCDGLRFTKTVVLLTVHIGNKHIWLVIQTLDQGDTERKGQSAKSLLKQLLYPYVNVTQNIEKNRKFCVNNKRKHCL